MSHSVVLGAPSSSTFRRSTQRHSGDYSVPGSKPGLPHAEDALISLHSLSIPWRTFNEDRDIAKNIAQESRFAPPGETKIGMRKGNTREALATQRGFLCQKLKPTDSTLNTTNLRNKEHQTRESAQWAEAHILHVDGPDSSLTPCGPPSTIGSNSPHYPSTARTSCHTPPSRYS